MKGLHPPLEEPLGKGRTLGQIPVKQLIQLYKASVAVAGVRVEGSVVTYGTPVSTQVQAATKFQKLFHTGEVITDAQTREAVHQKVLCLFAQFFDTGEIPQHDEKGTPGGDGDEDGHEAVTEKSNDDFSWDKFYSPKPWYPMVSGHTHFEFRKGLKMHAGQLICYEDVTHTRGSKAAYQTGRVVKISRESVVEGYHWTLAGGKYLDPQWIVYRIGPDRNGKLVKDYRRNCMKHYKHVEGEVPDVTRASETAIDALMGDFNEGLKAAGGGAFVRKTRGGGRRGHTPGHNYVGEDYDCHNDSDDGPDKPHSDWIPSDSDEDSGDEDGGSRDDDGGSGGDDGGSGADKGGRPSKVSSSGSADVAFVDPPSSAPPATAAAKGSAGRRHDGGGSGGKSAGRVSTKAKRPRSARGQRGASASKVKEVVDVDDDASTTADPGAKVSRKKGRVLSPEERKKLTEASREVSDKRRKEQQDAYHAQLLRHRGRAATPDQHGLATARVEASWTSPQGNPDSRGPPGHGLPQFRLDPQTLQMAAAALNAMGWGPPPRVSSLGPTAGAQSEQDTPAVTSDLPGARVGTPTAAPSASVGGSTTHAPANASAAAAASTGGKTPGRSLLSPGPSGTYEARTEGSGARVPFSPGPSGTYGLPRSPPAQASDQCASADPSFRFDAFGRPGRTHDADGYDKAGFNRDGVNRRGYDKDGVRPGQRTGNYNECRGPASARSGGSDRSAGDAEDSRDTDLRQEPGDFQQRGALSADPVLTRFQGLVEKVLPYDSGTLRDFRAWARAYVSLKKTHKGKISRILNGPTSIIKGCSRQTADRWLDQLQEVDKCHETNCCRNDMPLSSCSTRHPPPQKGKSAGGSGSNK